MTDVYRLPCLAALLLLLSPALAGSAPYDNLFFFGDSLSDVGNIDAVSGGILPISPYFNGRFSNGEVYSERLADLLELPTLVESLNGGTNYAYGGAETSGGVITSVTTQIQQYLDARTPESRDLFVVFAGANDFVGGQTNANVPVNNLIAGITQLIGAGAQNVLVGNLPGLGLTPRFNGNATEAAQMNQLSAAFNSSLASALDLLAISEPTVNFFQMDVAALIDDAVANPAQFGFVNVTDSAAPGLSGTDIFYFGNVVDEPNTYLFWDDLHPTAAAHGYLAEIAFDAVTYSADFNFDGYVDGLDLEQWQSAYNVSNMADADGDGNSDGDDFLEWQRQYGSGVPVPAGLAAVIPEPDTIVLMLLGLCLQLRRQQLRGGRKL